MHSTASPAKLKLFGLHHAGGSPASFAGWQYRLGPGTEVVPIALPGRGPDGRSTRYRDLASLVRELDQELGRQLDEPHLLYGHSLGALIAYALARYRSEQGRPAPERLLLGAFAAPHRAGSIRRALDFSEVELTHWLLGLADVPEHLIDEARGRGLLDRLRADLRIGASHRAEDPAAFTEPVLDCPIDVFLGVDDPLVRPADAVGWSRYSSAPTTFHLLPGGHFFPRESKTRFFSALRAVCEADREDLLATGPTGRHLEHQPPAAPGSGARAAS